MLLQLEGVGKQKIKYRNASEVDFSDLSEYILLAKKSISKFANGFYNGLATKMLKDEDAISNVANAIMMADWRYDENYENSLGNGKKTKYSYRNQCALWAIQTYVTKGHKKNKNKQKFYSLDYADNSEDATAYSYIEDQRSLSPDQILIQKEKSEDISKLINELLSINCLSEKQKDYIKLYFFENYTFEQIGKKYDLTREAIRQSLNKALSLIKESIQ